MPKIATTPSTRESRLAKATLAPTTPKRNRPSLTTSDSTSDDEDNDEHTLSGYGDISLGNAAFIPGPPTLLSPYKSPQPSIRMKDSSTQRPTRPAPPRRRTTSYRGFTALSEADVSVNTLIANTVNKGPSDVNSPQRDFGDLVSTLRTARTTKGTKSKLGREIAPPEDPILSPGEIGEKIRSLVDNMGRKGKVRARGNIPVFDPTEARSSTPEPSNLESNPVISHVLHPGGLPERPRIQTASSADSIHDVNEAVKLR